MAWHVRLKQYYKTALSKTTSIPVQMHVLTPIKQEKEQVEPTETKFSMLGGMDIDDEDPSAKNPTSIVDIKSEITENKISPISTDL